MPRLNQCNWFLKTRNEKVFKIDLVCWESGTCSGNLISRAVVTNEEECHESCRNQSGCTWFTYDEADLECVLLANCLEVDYEDCVTCLSSQKSCGERKGVLTLLF